MLQQEIETKSIHVQNCILAERKHREKASLEISKLKSNIQIISLIKPFRELIQTRLCRISLQREMSLKCVVILKIKRAESTSLLDDTLGLKSDLSIYDNDNSVMTITPINELLKQSTNFQHFVELDSSLSKILRELEDKYLSMFKNLSRIPFQRSVSIRSLLKSTTIEWIDSGVTFHEYDPQQQQLFNSLIYSRSYKEGELISHVVTTINSKQDEESLAQVMPFIIYLIELMAQSHHIEKESFSVLKLYLSRLIFSLISETAMRFAMLKTRELDITFRQNQLWLRKLSALQIGVPESFCDEKLFLGAASLLSEISFYVTPLDILNVFRNTCRTLLDQAKKGANDPDIQIDADSFFPIMIFACIHADIWDAHVIVRHLNFFCSAQEKVVEVGYYISCLEGSTQYITTANEESFLEQPE
eukprot:c11633_g1_i1.p1 GENE.c11633_g1_i1~~c11633_g1_i1.p1  ORF type:complete len:467 (+),score=142.95 c11633_g1_i1:151-1401(+)